MNYKIIKNTTKFLYAFDRPEPFTEWAEKINDFNSIAFLGRSNVGKSSLINSLYGKKTARVSNTPGRTREILIFSFEIENLKDKTAHPETFYLFDLPGYGYANVSKAMSKNWNTLLLNFFETVSDQTLMVNVQDARHPVQKADIDFFKFLDQFETSTLLALNKYDKLKKQSERSRFNKIMKDIIDKYQQLDSVYAVSAETNFGVDHLEKHMINFLLNN
jgi:GTP-binding protein